MSFDEMIKYILWIIFFGIISCVGAFIHNDELLQSGMIINAIIIFGQGIGWLFENN